MLSFLCLSNPPSHDDSNSKKGNAVSPITCPHTGGDGCGAWHDLPALVFLVFRLWPTRKRAPTSDVDTRGTASVALTPPIRTISILPFTIITTVKSAFLPGVMVVCPEGGSLTVTPSSSWDLCCSLIGLHRHTMVPVRVSSTLACRQVQWVPGRVLSSWQKKTGFLVGYGMGSGLGCGQL